MRKYIKIIVLLWGFLTMAQNFKYGVGSGINSSSFTELSGFVEQSNTAVDEIFKVGYQIGLFTQLEFNNNFSFVSELQFVNTKASFNMKLNDGFSNLISQFLGEDLNGNADGRLDINFYQLHVPLNFSYNFYRISFIGGPFMAYNFGGTLKSKGTIGIIDINESNSIELSPIDYGFNMGISFKLIENFTIYGKYTHGLSNFNPKLKGASVFSGSNDEIKYRGLSLSLIYFFK